MTTRPPTLTDARLDRIADLQRDLGALASALHYDHGYAPDDAIAVATDAFEAGKTVREWLASALEPDIAEQYERDPIGADAAMPRYTVTGYRTVVVRERTTIELEAPDRDAAQQLADDMLADDMGRFVWTETARSPTPPDWTATDLGKKD